MKRRKMNRQAHEGGRRYAGRHMKRRKMNRQAREGGETGRQAREDLQGRAGRRVNAEVDEQVGT
jgi:hypothetical protein